MIEDDDTPTVEQRLQLQAGSDLAMRCLLAALIETHPDRQALLRSLDKWLAETHPILLQGAALRADAGFRDAFSSAVRQFRAAAGGS